MSDNKIAVIAKEKDFRNFIKEFNICDRKKFIHIYNLESTRGILIEDYVVVGDTSNMIQFNDIIKEIETRKIEDRGLKIE